MAQKQQPTGSYVGNPNAVPGKMIYHDRPTPKAEDRIYLRRIDTRKGGYVEPEQGSAYSGPDAERFEGYFYICWRATDQIGWVDEIYLNDRLNQDDYNGEMTYPYTDKDYPRMTRTYVFRRGDQRADEPNADSNDPVFSDLKLVDHKIYRLNTGQYDFLDDMFVGIQRVYERLPGPVIRTYKTNEFQQVVNIDTQEVVVENVPTPNATTEVDVTQRTTTAKATVTLGTVDEVFPNTKFTTDRSEHIIPFKFRAKVPSVLVWQIEAGTAAQPVLAQDEWVGEEQQTTRFKKTTTRTLHTLPAGVGVSTLEYKLNNDQQVATIVDTWKATSQTFTPAPLLTEAKVDELGNGDTIKSETTIPEVFGATAYEKTIPDPIPERFRVAVPITEVSVTEEGTAVNPTLGTGDLSIRDEQRTVYWHRLTTRSRGTIVTTSLVSYKMTQDGQIETVTETLGTGLQTISPNELTVEAEVQNLGNNTSLKMVGVVPEVFGHIVSAKEIPDLVPVEFRPFIPVITYAESATGDVSIPVTLGTGELSRKEEQLTEFTFRRTIETRAAVVLPITHTNEELTSEFGGGGVNVNLTLAASGTESLDEGLLVLKSSIKDLGNGQEFKETHELGTAAWPTLTSRLWDENMRVEYDEFKKVVAAGTPDAPNPGGYWGWISEVKAIDKWRSIMINSAKPAPDYVDSGSALISYEMKPYRFPGYLQFSGTGYYTRNATAVLVQHEIRTWWEQSGSTPTVAFEEIVTDDVIINNLANTGIEYARNVLHDGFFFGTLSFPATTPTASQYSLGTPSGTTFVNLVTLYTPGTGYLLGDSLFISGDGGSATITVTAIGIAGSVLGYSPITGSFSFPAGLSGPYAASGGSGTGAAFYQTGVDLPSYDPGSKWIGSSRIVAASVTPEKEKDVWKIQTEAVIMR